MQTRKVLERVGGMGHTRVQSGCLASTTSELGAGCGFLLPVRSVDARLLASCQGQGIPLRQVGKASHFDSVPRITACGRSSGRLARRTRMGRRARLFAGPIWAECSLPVVLGPLSALRQSDARQTSSAIGRDLLAVEAATRVQAISTGAVYARRQPEKTALFKVMQQHLLTFAQQ
jgi:hypothetical protein